MKTAAALSCVLLLAGCAGAGSDEPAPAEKSSAPAPTASVTSAPDEAGVVVDIRIEDGEVTPQGERVEVEAGQQVTLEVSSDADEEIHVHSDPEHTYQVGPGDTLTETFTLETPGQVAVEAHHLGATIVQLVVRP